MKKTAPFISPHLRKRRLKTLLIMKLTAFFILITALQVSAKTYSQERISVNFNHTNLSKALKTIERESSYRFVFSNDVLSDKLKVTIKAKDILVKDLLAQMLTSTDLVYTEMGNNLVGIKYSDAYYADKIIVKGTVTDGKGNPLANVSVTAGTGIGTTTNGKGEYSISVDENSSLTFSFVEFTSKTIKVDKREILNVVLEEGNNQLSDVVVVGYGTQKKVNLTGSVASVSGSTITERPTANLGDLLEGRIAGLSVVQPTGEPGNDQGSLQIRGLGSYGANSAPLILVDGIAVASLNNLSAQDIASVTVLKDAASSSIYGSRAANGVILITTKEGKRGTNKLEYSNSFGTTSATKLPDLITNSVTYMQMYNAASERSGAPAIYTQSQIDAYKNGNGSPQFPNTDWMKYYFHSAPIQNHNLSLSGGDNLSTYYLSFGYLDQKGITDGYNYRRYNSVFNYTRKVNKRVSLGANINLSYENSLFPIFTNDAAILLAYAQAPTFSNFLPDGSGRVAVRDYISNGTPNRTLYERQNNGFQAGLYYNVQAQSFLNVNILKGLDWKTTGAVVFFNSDSKNRQYQQPFPVYAFQPDVDGNYIEITNHGLTSSLSQSSERDLTLTLNSIITYQKDFGENHHFIALAGYEQIGNTTTSIGGSRTNYTNSVINELNGGPTNGWNNNGAKAENALQSGFGRVNYSYKQRYLLEGDIRYDGTSKVAPANRWGLFGGGSAGWRISEENFIKNNATWISNLMLRGSYGILGNQNISNYAYQQVLNNTAYPFFLQPYPGVVLSGLVDPSLHWEKTATTDFGLDINLLKGLFGVTFDWYKKNTTEILAQQFDVPSSVGLSPPTFNSGGMVNKGFEIEMTHQNHIGRNFTYGANVIFSLNRNKVTYIAGAGNPGVFQVGIPYNSYYVYIWDGIFNSQEEIDNSPAQPNSGTLKPGDLKIKDVNGDGKITPDDRVSFSPYPKYTYSFGINAGWKGFNLAAFFQGVQGQKIAVSGWGFDPFLQGAPPDSRFLNAWTPENHSQTVPAVYQNGYPGVQGYNSTYSLLDASYLRLKNVNLSYSFTGHLLKSAKWLKNLTVFVSGDNIVTWTKYLGADPERSGSGTYAQYPQLKTYSAGAKISL